MPHQCPCSTSPVSQRSRLRRASTAVVARQMAARPAQMPLLVEPLLSQLAEIARMPALGHESKKR
jgi:hypothetical protein